MFSKIVLIMFLVTFSGSLSQDGSVFDNIFGPVKDLIKGISNVIKGDSFNMGLKERTDQAEIYLLNLFKRGVELTNEHIKLGHIVSEEDLEKTIKTIKKEDPELGEKVNKFYKKTQELIEITKEINRYVFGGVKYKGVVVKPEHFLYQW